MDVNNRNSTISLLNLNVSEARPHKAHMHARPPPTHTRTRTFNQVYSRGGDFLFCLGDDLARNEETFEVSN